MISTAAAASNAFSPSTPNASVESATSSGRQRLPPVLNMYRIIWFASVLSKFVARVWSIVFSRGRRQFLNASGKPCIFETNSLADLHESQEERRYLIGFAQRSNVCM